MTTLFQILYSIHPFTQNKTFINSQDMGAASLKGCWNEEDQNNNDHNTLSKKHKKQLKPKVIVKSKELHPTSSVSHDYSPDGNSRGLESFLEKSQMNSFYRDNQIGPFLHNEEPSSSYQGKMNKWKNMIETTPVGQTIRSANSNFSTQDPTSRTLQKGSGVVTSKREKEKWKDFPSPQQHSMENSFDVTVFSKNYQCVSNKLDSAVVCFNIMDQESFKQLLLEGPPNMRLRWSCWKTCLLKKGQVDTLDCEWAPQADDSDYGGAILKDIKRTISWHPFFQQAQNEHSEGHKQLLSILLAVSKQLPKLGYCQGMNFLAGTNVENYIDKGSFYSFLENFLLSLITSSNFLLYFIYVEDLPFLIFLEAFTIDMIKKNVPKIYQHIQEIELPTSFWITKIILSLFLYCFKIGACLRLWDFMLSTNIFGLVRLVVAMIECQEQTILQLDLSDFMDWFNSLAEKEDIDWKQVIQSAKEKFHISRVAVSTFAKQSPLVGPFVEAMKCFDDPKKFKRMIQELMRQDK